MASFCRQILRHGNALTSKTWLKAIPQNRSLSFSKCLAGQMYTKKHEWVLIENGTGTVGISDHAQNALGEIVYVEVPEVGTELLAEDSAGALESVKAASDVYSPVNGTVTEVNTTLEDTPGLVNKSPLTDGWLFKLKVADKVNTKHLMNAEAYHEYVGTLEEH